MKGGNDDVVFGEGFGGCQLDVQGFAAVRVDGYDLLYLITMKTNTSDGHVILPCGNGVNREGLITVCGKHLANDAGTCAIVPIEDDQDGIFLFHTGNQVLKFEPGDACSC